MIITIDGIAFCLTSCLLVAASAKQSSGPSKQVKQTTAKAASTAEDITQQGGLLGKVFSGLPLPWSNGNGKQRQVHKFLLIMGCILCCHKSTCAVELGSACKSQIQMSFLHCIVCSSQVASQHLRRPAQRRRAAGARPTPTSFIELLLPNFPLQFCTPMQ